MSFQLVYYSQQDPKWKADKLGFGSQADDTIGKYGCAITSIAMLLSGYGYAETPQSLNEKLKSKDGYAYETAIRWNVVSQIHSQVVFQESLLCENVDAPLARINATLAAGQPVVVRVDSSPIAGFQWHYVLLYGRKGDDYLMLDPYPYHPGTGEDLLMARYSQGRPLTRSIQQVLFYQCTAAGGSVSTPDSSGTTGTTPTQPTTTPVSDGPRARVQASLTWGLNIRSSADTSSPANIVVSVPAGTELVLLDADGASKLGTQQMVRVREPGGREGWAAAWYLDPVAGSSSAPSTGSSSAPVSEAPAAPPPPVSSENIQVRVTDEVTAGLRIRSSTNTSSDANIVTIVNAGTVLTLVNATDESKIGLSNQWVRVRTAQGQEGMAAAWYLEKTTASAPASGSTTPASTNIVRSRPSIADGLEAIPMEAPAGSTLNDGNLLGRIWTKYGGLLSAIAQKMSFDPAIAVAIIAQESGGQAYNTDGRLPIRFENHLFYTYWGKQHSAEYNDHFQTGSLAWTGHKWRPKTDAAWRECHTSQSVEWEVFTFAQSLDETAAKKSISMGLPQILGSNFNLLGFASVQDMYNAFAASERNQVVAFFDFLQGNGTIATNALKQCDFRTIASIYNGAGNADQYGKLIQSHYNNFIQLRGTQPTGTPSSSTSSTTSTPSTTTPSQPMDPNKKYLVVSDVVGPAGIELRKTASNTAVSQMHLTPGMLLIVIEPYAKATGKLGKTGQWIYVRGPNRQLGYILSQFVRLP